MIGKLIGIGLLGGSLAIIYLFEGTTFGHGAMRILHWPAVILTFFGPLGIMLMASDFPSVAKSLTHFFSRSLRARQRQREIDTAFLGQLTKRFYTEGAAVFDGGLPKKCSKMVRKVVERLGMRIPNLDVHELVETERNRLADRLTSCLTVVSLGVRLAPSVGMLGTILGMVQLLSKLEDPSQIGHNMSLALFTTFYGLFFSVVLWTPLHFKLERSLAQEMQAYDEVLHWLDLLERRKPVDYFHDATNQKPKTVSTEARAA